VDTITKLGKDVFDVTAFGFADFGELTAAISSGSLKKNKGGIAGGVKFTLTTADGEVTVEILNSPTLKDYHFGFVPDASEITGDAETLITDFDAIADYGLAGFNEMPIAPTGTTGNGTNGQDVYISNNAKDKIKTKGGSDLTFGGDGVNNVNAGGGNDLLFGGSGNDILNGSSGDDVIVGGTGKDKLRGGNDHDVLIGGAENDNLGGGAGADLFIFRSGTGFDKIIDFENDIDTIHIEHLTALGDITHQIIGGKHTRLKLGDGTIQIQNRVIDLDDIQFEFGTSAILDAVDAFTI
jgi:Ca2+-binding RTX toxin-like protein